MKPPEAIVSIFSAYVYVSVCLTTDYGLRTPNEAIFHQNPKLLGVGRQFGQISFGAFGVFSTNLSAPILVL